MKSIIIRFVVLSRIIIDNGTQLSSVAFIEYCKGLGTTVCFASVAHPHSNEQVEQVNRLVIQGIESHIFNLLSAYAKAWASELPNVLWALQTTSIRAMGDTFFPNLQS